MQTGRTVSTDEKRRTHERFWRGDGPSLILIPPGRSAQYDVEGYRERFDDPRAMWAAEMRRARAILDWPTDGIPTVRPNLGVVFIPAIAGQGYEIREGQMPWPGAPLERETIRDAAGVDVTSARLMRLAAGFYEIHRAEGGGEIAAYLPDTQSVFDVAHLLNGKGLFYDVADDPEWVHELLGICLDLYLRVTRHLKALLDEPEGAMVHGHGTAQGVYLPHAGARTSEDTATLLSPRMIDEFVLPYAERAVRPFGAASSTSAAATTRSSSGSARLPSCAPSTSATARSTTSAGCSSAAPRRARSSTAGSRPSRVRTGVRTPAASRAWSARPGPAASCGRWCIPTPARSVPSMRELWHELT